MRILRKGWELNAFLKRIKLPKFMNMNTPKATLEVQTSSGDRYEINYVMNVPSRSNPKKIIPVGMQKHVTLPLTEGAVLDATRSAVLGLVAHEVDECLILDGKRVYDPHQD